MVVAAVLAREAMLDRIEDAALAAEPSEVDSDEREDRILEAVLVSVLRGRKRSEWENRIGDDNGRC